MTDFIRKTTTRDAATGEVTVTTTTIPGEAFRVSRVRQGEMQQFAAQGLSLSETAVLFWTPDAYRQTPDRPRPGDTTTWEDVGWTAVWVNPIALDGPTLSVRVGVRR